ncbi:hypothetical protein OGAPHI_003275 [Ogataea philodendri]|uniref:Uncharacterized protein n=1 Tax=Ogataea philodendri TaxID=1378263 RepID=A0A9P8T5H9_9ASCO|nr:uncharacterized protein OGAPHI_003275 [Ogataea philodendri]KAH3666826.1 hypothetical protein OGAPHI_003275 [Ogataea philodendri]
MSQPNYPNQSSHSVPSINIVPATQTGAPPSLPARPSASSLSLNTLATEEEVIASLPPSPKYTEQPSPGELSIPNNQAIDPLSINDERPETDPPEYSEMSSAVAPVVSRPPFADMDIPPPTPERPPTRPPRPNQRPQAARYQRPQIPPPVQPQMYLQPQQQYNRPPVPTPVHPIYAPPPSAPPLPQRPSSPSSI